MALQFPDHPCIPQKVAVFDDSALAKEAGIEIHLTVADQRKLVEHDTKEPCFRMWVSKSEFKRAEFADWTSYELSDGRIAIWRKVSDLTRLMDGGEVQLWRHIKERTLTDSEE